MTTAAEMLKEHNKQREALILADEKHHFSFDLEATLTAEERTANEKLQQMREVVANNHELNRSIHSFFDHKAPFEASQLF